MLTLNFIKANKSKTVVSCDSYDVDECPSGTSVVVTKGFGDNAVSEEFIVNPNSDEYTVCFVTNLSGRTVDRIGG